MSSRPKWVIPVAIVAAIALVVVLPLVGTYNGLVGRSAAADQSFADLDSQLQRRNDLTPNLVNAVRAALKQEQTVFGDIARARQNYAGASTPQQKFDASNEMSGAISRLLVIVEQYPQLKSNENIRDLMTQLEGTENRIQQARRDYNGVVTSYNVAIRRFPRNLVAGMLGFHTKPLFQAAPSAREAPVVDLGANPTP